MEATYNPDLFLKIVKLNSDKKDIKISAILALIGSPVGVLYSNVKIGAILYTMFIINLAIFTDFDLFDIILNPDKFLNNASFMIISFLIYFLGLITSIRMTERHNRRIEKELTIALTTIKTIV